MIWRKGIAFQSVRIAGKFPPTGSYCTISSIYLRVGYGTSRQVHRGTNEPTKEYYNYRDPFSENSDLNSALQLKLKCLSLHLAKMSNSRWNTIKYTYFLKNLSLRGHISLVIILANQFSNTLENALKNVFIFRTTPLRKYIYHFGGLVWNWDHNFNLRNKGSIIRWMVMYKSGYYLFILQVMCDANTSPLLMPDL